MTIKGVKEVTNVRKKWATIILAAGKGTRMKSSMAKVLHRIGERTILSYPLELASDIGSDRIIVIVGHQAEQIRQAVDDGQITFVHQEQQLGTGHAIQQTGEALKDFEGNVLILCGDVPLLLPSTVHAMMDSHIGAGASITVLTALLDDPAKYGRVVKDRHDNVRKIVEERDATDDEKKIQEINTGIYCVESKFLYEAVEHIDNDNAQNEYYLTDIFEIARNRKAKVVSLIVSDPHEAMGINTRADLEEASRIMMEREGNIRSTRAPVPE